MTMLKFFQAGNSDFAIKEINHTKQIIIVEDASLGLQCEVTFGASDLVSAEISGPYSIKLTYANGTSEEKIFLK
jgi:hypothetical protein